MPIAALISAQLMISIMQVCVSSEKQPNCQQCGAEFQIIWLFKKKTSRWIQNRPGNETKKSWQTLSVYQQN